jgi:ubiquinone biosynthesis protein
MRGPHNIWRLIRTGATFERTGAMRAALEAMNAPPHVRVAARIVGWPFQWLGVKGDPSMPPVTRALTALGPAYIKFGQTMSTRPDVVGEELAGQLQVLQDKLAPFPVEEAKAEVARELEVDVDTFFSEFSDSVAAASIAQVHRARIAETGDDVAVKVLRPGIERAFRRDIDAFYFAARMVELLAPAARRLKPMEVITHFEGVVNGELDLRMETSAAGEFASNTAEDEGFEVPEVIWALSARRVMTLRWAEGIPMHKTAELTAAGFDCPRVGEKVLEFFLLHALRDGYFHADMHQGNLRVGPSGNIVAIDFGIMGRIDEYTRRVYAEILIGFLRKDYRRVAEVHFEAGYVPADRDIDEFAQALRSVGEPIFGMEASRISMGRLLNQLFEVTERFGMETRTELILLQRTMVVVEGVSRSLNPHINIWEVSQPIVTTYISKNVGPKALVRDLTKTVRILANFGPKLPILMEELLIRQSETSVQSSPRRAGAWKGAFWFCLGAIVAATAGFGLGYF